ncbi:sigma-70 family RNA polymerase sigma factor [candidate division KSB1 bacterium]|nr:sigma-70 family RNA polymerase sigma factor [candidate division KSB1 bacterium]NIR69976.1 sigma-70 family RNA polymerase sigma factor [candidate division KSB1 bacterium]NIS25876.1 sigma-70 family RNA polymerase sigma factor [candidate division KSB1 bacterium]NIT72752.1 sigma-70 family RNA polymerase sigma factor [candidate division KSB1 bacterium]NIU26564.1 sigma-70 family RNA polymerase sigma factor [candidate division KSB1 bacterium]
MKTTRKKQKPNTQTNNMQKDSTRVYLDEISEIPVLTRDEERELIPRAQKGDREAVDKLIRSNLRFVVQVAREYQNRGLPLADLISEGNIGLMRALKTFDPGKGLKFITYAVWWIRQAMQQAMFNISHTVRLPQNRLRELRQTRQTAETLEKKLNRPPSSSEIDEALGSKRNGINTTSEFLLTQHSLEAPLDHDSAKRLLNLIPNEGSTQPDEQLKSESLKQELESAFGLLATRERTILRQLYGLDGDRALNLGEVGERLGISRERVRQIRNEALAKLRRSKRVNRTLKEYL